MPGPRQTRRAFPAALAFVVLGLVAGACGEPTFISVPTGCLQDTDCKGARICLDRACVYPDNEGPGTGWEGPGPPPGAVGSACEEELDCAGARAMCLTEFGFFTFPGGYCTEPCSTDTDCSEDSICDGLSGVCVDSCETDTDCREGYACQPFFDSPLACRPELSFP